MMYDLSKQEGVLDIICLLDGGEYRIWGKLSEVFGKSYMLANIRCSLESKQRYSFGESYMLERESYFINSFIYENPS